MENIEIWKGITGFENNYQVSNIGRVRSLDRIILSKNGRYLNYKGRLLSPAINSRGYLCILLCMNCKIKSVNIHQLVAIEFLNHIVCGKKLVVNHIDFNKLNNNVNNLEIVTFRENTNRKHIKSSSKYVGVSWDKNRNKWSAKICINGLNKTLGRFKTEIEAHNEYQKALSGI